MAKTSIARYSLLESAAFHLKFNYRKASSANYFQMPKFELKPLIVLILSGAFYAQKH